MARIVNRFLRTAALLAMAIAVASFASPVTASELGFGVGATARVTAVRFYTELRQNVADLAGTFTSGASYEANFLTNFDRTGGVERWGFPTSAIFEETRGTLTQYYQRGVVDWKLSPSGDRHTFQRRLAWDHLGGGLGGSQDQGVEPAYATRIPAKPLAPGATRWRTCRWRVSRPDSRTSSTGSAACLRSAIPRRTRGVTTTPKPCCTTRRGRWTAAFGSTSKRPCWSCTRSLRSRP